MLIYECILEPVGLRAAGPRSPLLFRDLANGIAYIARVRACTKAGAGPWSALSSPATPLAPPGTPTLVAEPLAGDAQLKVAFEAPVDDGGTPIVGCAPHALPSTP